MLFRERLRVPLSWWLLAALLAVTMLVVVGFYVGPGWGLGVALGTLAGAATLFSSTAVLISVDADELRVGRSVLERTYIGGCRALDAEATELRAGVQADGRAHLVLRPYIATAVEIELDDPDDPVPYWLVSSRRPARLAAALAPVSASGPAQ
jgi:hypothetical protein